MKNKMKRYLSASYAVRGSVALVALLALSLLAAGCADSSKDNGGAASAYRPAEPGQVELDRLQGMYYGFSPDYDGSECGGMCWNIVTFLPDGQLFLDAPPSGGPETIDCAEAACQPYRIENGELLLEDGETRTIEVVDDTLIIDDVELAPVLPVQEDLTLDQQYTHQGFSGLVGISAGSTSWQEDIVLRRDGTYESSNLMLGSVEGGAPTTGAAGSDASGTYRISGNTISLTNSLGETEHALFFIHVDDDSIQIGDRNFLVEP
ncbi:hypothetical protein PA598K_04246 [Paenibacillus sp. 598K]|uniref:hypothetical protein n=1 Tax=Paenibacillus sp. 598K TaxID=1117987 RepID=UPI000FFA2999|nr:hypothetical protein [Paenibacillus sp. 598K]GBF75814.1 hypothetical protein PA598K_04246 [Paenibacillus sp. 598K]